MKRYSLARTAVVIFLLGFAAYGQDQDKTINTEIIYTGRFLGYARVPSLQAFTVNKDEPRCPAISPTRDSEAAVKFLASRNMPAHKDAILRPLFKLYSARRRDLEQRN